MSNGAIVDKYKLEIESTVCSYTQFVQEVNLKPYTNYEIQYSIKTRNVLENCQGDRAGSNKWGAGVWIKDEDNQLSEHKSYYNTNKWKKNKLTFNSKEANKAKLYLQLGGFNGSSRGYVQFKDVKMFPTINNSNKKPTSSPFLSKSNLSAPNNLQPDL